MSKDKAEEKANNAQLFLIENKLNDLVISPLWCKDKVYVSDTLMEYTDSLSIENAKLREALRELVKSIDDYTYYSDTSTIEEEQSDINLSDALYKANQLLTDKE